MSPDPYERELLERSTGKPDRWPWEVATRLRAIFEMLRSRESLDVDDCRFVGRTFIFPNLVNWVFEMQQPAEATPYKEECPVSTDKRDCVDAQARLCTTQGIPSGHRDDLCRCRLLAHPWSHLITLVFNGHPRWRGSVNPGRQYPSADCAREFWRGIVDNDEVKRRWDRITVANRESRLSGQWNRIASAAVGVANRTAADDTNIPETVRQGIPPEWLVKYCLCANQLVERWIDGQRRVGEKRYAEARRVLLNVLKALEISYANGWEFPAEWFRREIDDLVKVVRDVMGDSPEIPQEVFDRPMIDRAGQEVLLDFLKGFVLVYLNRPLPPGDPLDDPIVQDIFWYRVGGSPVLGGRPFQVHDWAVRRWSPVGPDDDAVPCWMTRP